MGIFLLKAVATAALLVALMAFGVVACYYSDNCLLAEQKRREDSSCSG